MYASIIVYDVQGRKVKELISNKMFNPGVYSVKWNALDVTSGVYFIQLKTNQNIYNQKVILIK